MTTVFATESREVSVFVTRKQCGLDGNESNSGQTMGKSRAEFLEMMKLIVL